MHADESTHRNAIAALFKKPILDLIYRAATVHRTHHDPRQVQVCTLLSIKTGGCSENCGYCSQSAHFDTGLARQDLLSVAAVQQAAEHAAATGPTYYADIKPILDGHCINCHSDEAGISPFPLTTYASAAAIRDRVAEAVSAKRMPPWGAEPGHTPLKYDVSLSIEAYWMSSTNYSNLR